MHDLFKAVFSRRSVGHTSSPPCQLAKKAVEVTINRWENPYFTNIHPEKEFDAKTPALRNFQSFVMGNFV